jgi:mannose-6-phosphate isomerase class I
MGTHPSGPSAVLATGVDLKQYLSDHPDQLGLAVSERFGDLPFLFKVLAIKKALSIQAHPDKKLAQRLHRERPDVYKGMIFVCDSISRRYLTLHRRLQSQGPSCLYILLDRDVDRVFG